MQKKKKRKTRLYLSYHFNTIRDGHLPTTAHLGQIDQIDHDLHHLEQIDHDLDHLGHTDNIDHDLDHIGKADQIDHDLDQTSRSPRTDRKHRPWSRQSISSPAFVRGCAKHLQGTDPTQETCARSWRLHRFPPTTWATSHKIGHRYSLQDLDHDLGTDDLSEMLNYSRGAW